MILMWLFGLFLNIKPIFVHKDIEMNVKGIMVFLLGFQGISLYHLGCFNDLDFWNDYYIGGN